MGSAAMLAVAAALALASSGCASVAPTDNPSVAYAAAIADAAVASPRKVSALMPLACSAGSLANASATAATTNVNNRPFQPPAARLHKCMNAALGTFAESAGATRTSLAMSAFMIFL